MFSPTNIIINKFNLILWLRWTPRAHYVQSSIFDRSILIISYYFKYHMFTLRMRARGRRGSYSNCAKPTSMRCNVLLLRYSLPVMALAYAMISWLRLMYKGRPGQKRSFTGIEFCYRHLVEVEVGQDRERGAHIGETEREREIEWVSDWWEMKKCPCSRCCCWGNSDRGLISDD